MHQHLRSLAPVMNDNGGQMMLGDLGGLKLPDICLRGEEKPRKNLTQETCPDRGSNPGLLRDRHACCRLSHNGGHGYFIYAQCVCGVCIFFVTAFCSGQFPFT